MFKIFLLLAFATYSSSLTEKWKTVYQKISEERFSKFHELIKNNPSAKFKLHYNDLTVFVPIDNGFGNFTKNSESDAVFYHMSFELKRMRDFSVGSMFSCLSKYPPLWISKNNEEFFVNNAKILSKLDYVARSRNGETGNLQIMHVIDEPLDPSVVNGTTPPTAYDFLQNSENWNIGYNVTSFCHKVIENRLQHFFKQGPHTFFIPVDQGIDNYKFSLIDKYTIFGHIIPNVVLFTKPVQKNFIFESKANGDYIYIFNTFVEIDNKMFIKSNTVLGDSTHEKGELFAEVLKPNIPLLNGVAHLISKPLAVFDRKLKPFPYISLLQKLESDPSLDLIYRMGNRSGFNSILKNESLSLTYFVTRDKSWKRIEATDLVKAESDLDILKRHLIISDSPLSMDKLLSLSRAGNYSDFRLETLGGPLYVSVLKTDGQYYIKWQKSYIRVIRADYECSNGIMHVLDGPMTRFKKRGEVQEETCKGFWGLLKCTVSKPK